MKLPTTPICICLQQPRKLYLNRLVDLIRVQQHAHNPHMKTYFDCCSSVLTMKWTIVFSHCWWWGVVELGPWASVRAC